MFNQNTEKDRNWIKKEKSEWHLDYEIQLLQQKCREAENRMALYLYGSTLNKRIITNTISCLISCSNFMISKKKVNNQSRKLCHDEFERNLWSEKCNLLSLCAHKNEKTEVSWSSQSVNNHESFLWSQKSRIIFIKSLQSSMNYCSYRSLINYH